LLVQLAREDFYVPPDQIEAWRQALGSRGELRVYSTSHAMEVPQALTDRDEFLRRTLGLGGPSR